mgnify:CR=1 FL=1
MTMDGAIELGKILKARGWTIGCAESCTGGLLTSRLTDIDGSSAYVKGGVISYATEVKINLLKVRAATVEKFGVVSVETAIEMAAGVRRLLGVDVGLSTTGYAGPTGDQVGLVCIGLSTADGTAAQKFSVCYFAMSFASLFANSTGFSGRMPSMRSACV